MVAKIFLIMESIARLPSQVQSIPFVLIAKEKGGFRPIALFVGLCRVWAKSRRPVTSLWQARHDRPYFACGKGRAPQDCVWRQALRSEVAAAASGHTAMVLWDAHKFFELFDLKRLFYEAIALGLPQWLVRLAVATYAGPRMFNVASMWLQPRFARCGRACLLDVFTATLS